MALAIGVAGSLALGSQTVLAVAPKITSFTPTSGPIGTQVVITETALSSPSALKFDGTTATFRGATANCSARVVIAIRRLLSPMEESTPAIVRTSPPTALPH
jgi:hypothetical protein